MRRLLPLLCLLALLAVPATASATDETVSSGSVSATFSYHCPQPVDCSGLGIRIFRGGAQSLSQGISSSLNPGRPSPDKSVELRQLDPDSEPEVLLDLTTGGAHCCLRTYVYDFRDGLYVRRIRRWGDPAYVLRNLDHRGRPEFKSGDPRFSGLYTSFVESRWPLLVLRYQGARFRDVTRIFDNAIRRDRDSHLRFYRTLRKERADVRGAIAAYQADNYLLSRRTAARGWRLLKRLADQGKLKRVGGNPGPSGRAYLRSLQRKLRRFGYTR